MTRLAEGDREAFHLVFVVLRPLLYHFAAQKLEAAEAEDVAQEALLKVFSRAADFDPERDGLSWAPGIAAYEMKTARRRREGRRESPLETDELAKRTDASPSPEDVAIAASLDAVLDQTLRQLSRSDEETLRAFSRGETPEDVAGATFRKRVERARSRLRSRWGAKREGKNHDEC